MGPKRTRTGITKATTRALPVQRAIRPSLKATIRPKRDRLDAHTHSEPPRVPSTEYHCTSEVLSANAFPSTSQGQEISAEVR